MSHRPKTVINPGVPYLVTLTCRHSALFNIAPPRIGDLITCYSCGIGRRVLRKEPVTKNARSSSSSSEEGKESSSETTLSDQGQQGYPLALGYGSRA